MGAGGSKVYLQADKPYYYTGDAVTGSVVFHAEQPITLRKIQIKVHCLNRRTARHHHSPRVDRQLDHTTVSLQLTAQLTFESLAVGTILPVVS